MDIAHWIERHAAFSPGKIAIRFGGQDLTYAALAERVAQACGRLRALGVGPGDVVAFLGLNNPEMLALLFACARLRAILLPLNWRLAPPEHARVLAVCTPRAVVVEPAFLAHCGPLQGPHQACRWVALGPAPAGWHRWDEIGAMEAAGPQPGGLEAPNLLCYTSGSAGPPKGVVLTQGGLFWNAVNSAHMHDLTSADRVLTTLPMFHVGGLNIQTLPALHAGATVVLHARFDASATIEAMERERITLAVLVPAQLTAMMEQPRWTAADLSSARLIAIGSTIVPRSLIERVGERGLRVVQVYGSTETCPIATYVRTEDAVRKAGSAGLPALHCEVRVVDIEDRHLGPGRDGEILVRGPNVMRGYWNAPEATAEALRGGWYHTGDIGHFDSEGYLHVVARKHDMIISGGENIYPAELESILLECPRISEACVVGQPDERWGEAVLAVVVLKPGMHMTEADVAALFAGRVARYKQPRRVCFMDALPRTALGKVARGALRAAVTATAAA
jgi:fatty-acyl-CoA synthase